jgi:DNA-binding XRE family transcriptional regulator
MSQPVTSMPLPAERALRKLGRDLALARRKRGIATSDMAARLFVSRDTLWRLERGDPTVALGTLVTAAFILNSARPSGKSGCACQRRPWLEPG